MLWEIPFIHIVTKEYRLRGGKVYLKRAKYLKTKEKNRNSCRGIRKRWLFKKNQVTEAFSFASWLVKISKTLPLCNRDEPSPKRPNLNQSLIPRRKVFRPPEWLENLPALRRSQPDFSDRTWQSYRDGGGTCMTKKGFRRSSINDCQKPQHSAGTSKDEEFWGPSCGTWAVTQVVAVTLFCVTAQCKLFSSYRWTSCVWNNLVPRILPHRSRKSPCRFVSFCFEIRIFYLYVS